MTVEEIVARALCRDDYTPSARIEDIIERHWRDYAGQARASILAIADNVTDEMAAVAEKEFLNVFAFTRAEGLKFAIAAALRSALAQGEQ